jgi:hypothetical protein
MANKKARLPEPADRAVEALARRRGVSWQCAFESVLTSGLLSLGAPGPAQPPSDDDLAARHRFSMTPETYRAMKSFSRDHGLSHGEAARLVVSAGLNAIARGAVPSPTSAPVAIIT